MLQPTGPLPPEVYWRRRALAVGGVIVVVLLIVLLINSFRSGGNSEADSVAASSSMTTSASTTRTTSASPTTGNGSGGGGAAAGAQSPGGPGESSGGASGGGNMKGETPGGGNASGEAPGGVPDGEAPGEPPAGQPIPGQCPDQSLAIKVATDKPTYQAGEEPVFTTVITNIGTETCDRDLGSGLQQVLVYTIDGALRLWSNIDCYPQSEPDIRSLAPGEQAQFTVTWSATTSSPDCLAQPAPQRDPVVPGAYTVVGQLGELRSVPEPFNLG
ncbi:hypothetical protein [Rhodococcus sp. NPDC049939]|uniref:hypothetical protein n=1 Tax=Rhodococcus sp. NPDC049939 TaxID=3155511 RepID=UPI0033D19F77